VDSIRGSEALESQEHGSSGESRQEVGCMLRQLLPREARVVAMYYGLQDGTAYTLDEIAVRFDITRERVRQIKESAIDKLRLIGAEVRAEADV
jgi:RNA polymerase primary sigma factor